MTKKVFLINPPAVNGVKMVREGRCMQREGAWTAVWAPITLCTMAALLEKEGFETKVLDAIMENVGFGELEEILRKEKPDILVINTATPSIESDLSVASLAKKIDKNIKTVAFGIHVTALPEDSFTLEPKLDFIIRGEPEITLLELVKRVQNGRKVKGLAGLSWHEGGKVVQEKDRSEISNLDSLPMPAWEKIDVNKYLLPFSNKPFLLVDTGRGCPYNCKFCAAATFYGKRKRYPSAKRIVDEMERNLNKFKVKDTLFWAESFTMNKKLSQEVCLLILKRKLSVSWVCNSRADSVDLEQLKLFKKAGCWMIGFGVESGDNQILKEMGKNLNVEQIRKAVLMSKEAGLEVTGHMILGYPGETRETIKKTIDLACELPFDFVQFYACVPFPGSELYQEAKKKGYLARATWSEFEQNFSVMELPGLSGRELEKMRGQAYKKFYLRPKTIIRTLARLRSPTQAINFIKMARGFADWT